jgi:hypothetical protein
MVGLSPLRRRLIYAVPYVGISGALIDGRPTGVSQDSPAREGTSHDATEDACRERKEKHQH